MLVDTGQAIAGLRAEKEFLEDRLFKVKARLAAFERVEYFADNPLPPLGWAGAGQTKTGGNAVSRRSPLSMGLLGRSGSGEAQRNGAGCPAGERLAVPDYDPALIKDCDSFPQSCETLAVAHGNRINATGAAKAIRAAGHSDAAVKDISTSIKTTLRNKDNWEREAPGFWRLLWTTETEVQKVA